MQNHKHDGIQIQRFNCNHVWKTYIVRGNRVSVIASRHGKPFEKDLCSNSEEKRQILREARHVQAANSSPVA